MNLADYSSSGVQYRYQITVVQTINPLNGPTLGNTTVVLSGYGFGAPCINCYINKDLWCLFGNAPKVPAFFGSANEISCISPRYSMAGVVRCAMSRSIPTSSYINYCPT